MRGATAKDDPSTPGGLTGSVPEVIEMGSKERSLGDDRNTTAYLATSTSGFHKGSFEGNGKSVVLPPPLRNLPQSFHI
jgi:hypothetical protein